MLPSKWHVSARRLVASGWCLMMGRVEEDRPKPPGRAGGSGTQTITTGLHKTAPAYKAKICQTYIWRSQLNIECGMSQIESLYEWLCWYACKRQMYGRWFQIWGLCVCVLRIDLHYILCWVIAIFFPLKINHLRSRLTMDKWMWAIIQIRYQIHELCWQIAHQENTFYCST